MKCEKWLRIVCVCVWKSAGYSGFVYSVLLWNGIINWYQPKGLKTIWKIWGELMSDISLKSTDIN